MPVVPPSSRGRGLLLVLCGLRAREPLGMELLLTEVLPAELKSPVLSLHHPHSSFFICPFPFSFPAPPIPVLPIFLPFSVSFTLPL